MRRPRHLYWGALGIAGVLVAVVASAVQSTSGDPDLPVPEFVDLQETWTHATRGVPLPLEWVSFATNALQKPEATGKSAGGITLIGGTSGGSSGGSSPPVALLPIVSLASGDALEAHRRSMGLQRFLTVVSRYRPASGSAASDAGATDARTALLQALPSWTRASHLELLVTEAVMFLAGASIHEKCLHYDRLQEHAVFLDWRAVSGAPAASPAGGTNAAAAVPTAWGALETKAKAFYDGYLAQQASLAKVCDLSPPVSNSDVEKEVKDVLEARVVERFQELAAQVGSALETPIAGLVALEERSAVDVPTKQMFELSRSVQNTASLVDYVQKDELGLETARNGIPSLRAQAVAAEQSAKDEAANQVGGMDQLDAGAADLAAALRALGAIAGKLRDIGSIAGLTTELALCRNIVVSNDPTPAQNDALSRDIDRCLGAIGQAYTRLSSDAGQDPRLPQFREFASKVAGLSQRIAGVYRAEAHSNR